MNWHVNSMMCALVSASVLAYDASLAFAVEKPTSSDATPSVANKSNTEGARDTDKERRRDYTVLEAALNDLTSSRNPEYRYLIKNGGPRRDIVFDKQCYTEMRWRLELGGKSRNLDGSDVRIVPQDIQHELRRRNRGAPRSFSDFKPANTKILIRDLDREFKDSEDFDEDFGKKYPSAWGYVRAYLPGYSKDGGLAMVVFEGGPSGTHGANWVYMLGFKKGRWEVLWRHLNPRD